MAPTKEALNIMKVIILLMDKYNYLPLKVEQLSTIKEFWMINQNNKYPLIRITSYTDVIDIYNVDRIISVYNLSLNRAKNNGKVINIHFGSNQVDRVNDLIEDVAIDIGYCSNETILKSFPELKTVLTEITDLDKEYQESSKLLRKTNIKRAMFNRPASLKEVPLSYWTVGICVIVFILTRYFSNRFNNEITGVLLTGAYYKTLIIGNFEIWRLLAAGFVHYDILHFVVNMYSLLQVGQVIEREYDKTTFIITLVLSIIFGHLFLLVGSNNVVTVGISGGIYGLIGLLIVYTFESGAISNPKIRSSMLNMIIVNAIICFMPNISIVGHIGGLVCGLLCGLIMSKKPEWHSLRINAIIASIALVTILGVAFVKDSKKTPLYQGTDYLYTSALKELNLEKYAKKSEQRLEKYYYSVGE